MSKKKQFKERNRDLKSIKRNQTEAYGIKKQRNKS